MNEADTIDARMLPALRTAGWSAAAPDSLGRREALIAFALKRKVTIAGLDMASKRMK